MFAIAITPLVIEIGAPHVEGQETLLGTLLEECPSYPGYVISFCGWRDLGLLVEPQRDQARNLYLQLVGLRHAVDLDFAIRLARTAAATPRRPRQVRLDLSLTKNFGSGMP